MTNQDKGNVTGAEASSGIDAASGKGSDTNKDAGSEKSDATGNVAGLRRARPCPVCSKPSVKTSYPFCSARCKDVDLGRWLKGSYAIPSVEQDDPDDEDFDNLS